MQPRVIGLHDTIEKATIKRWLAYSAAQIDRPNSRAHTTPHVVTGNKQQVR